MKEYACLKFVINNTHPAYKQVREESLNARQFQNTLTAITRNYYFHKRDKTNADLTISQYYNIDITKQIWDKKEKTYKDWFSYNKNFLPIAEITKPIRTSINPKFNSKIAQGIARKIGDIWTSYWELRKTSPKAKIPGYNKNKYGSVPYNNGLISQAQYKKGYIKSTTWKNFDGFQLPEYAKNKVKSMEIVPVSARKFVLHVYYDKNLLSDGERAVLLCEKQVRELKQDRNLVAGLDFGLKNLMTIAYNDTRRDGFIVSGKPIVRSLYHFNNVIDKRVSIVDRSRGGELGKNGLRHYDFGACASVRELYFKSSVVIKNYYTLVNNRVVCELLDAGVSLLVIGWNEDFKKGVTLGRRTNRKFMRIPHAAIRDDLVRKCERVGIEVVITEESYTSKSSWFDNDVLPVFDPDCKRKYKFSGRRVKRGLYRTKSGVCLNADMNGALNIIRKVLPDFSPSYLGNGSVVPQVRRLKID